MPWLPGRFLLITACSIASLAQAPVDVVGVKLPPEWCGAPKTVKRPPDGLKVLADLGSDLKDPAKVPLAIDKLDQALRAVPSYSDGYLMRAMFRRMLPGGGDTPTILADIESAISTHPGTEFPSSYKTLSPHYCVRARIRFDNGQFKEAMDDLETALKQDFDDGERMFNASGVKPDATATDPSSWSLQELDALEARFPKDYRIHLFQGLYRLFFTTFDQVYYQAALQEFERAATLNPRSPLPPFYIGRVWSKKSFWTKEAQASDKAKAALREQALAAFTTAIKLDPTLEPAFEHRAGQLEGLHRYTDAIKDYDQALNLEPTNWTAMGYRAGLEMRAGLNRRAIFDYHQVIANRKPDDDYLYNLYDHRGEAYVKEGMYLEAIADFSKAIELQFGQMTILFSLNQIRGLYPEFNGVSDEDLIHKVNSLFWPSMSNPDLADTLLHKNGKWVISLLNDLYEKRGDAYLRTNDFRHGVMDFQRIFVGIPTFAASTDRWRSIGKTKDEEKFLDVKSVEFPSKGKGRIWIKTVAKKSTVIRSCEIDVPARCIRVGSTITYDAKGNVLRKNDYPTPWEAIVPGSIGEDWLNGLTVSTDGASGLHRHAHHPALVDHR